MKTSKCPYCSSSQIETIRAWTNCGLKAFFGLFVALLIFFFLVDAEHPIKCLLFPMLISASLAFPLYLIERKAMRFACTSCGRKYSQAQNK